MDRGDEFWRFAREMWFDNCKEREEYKQPLLTFEKYLSLNEKFLMHKFYEEVQNNREKKGWFKWR